MPKLGKWLMLLGLIISLTTVTFLIYAHFLVDYSLENLGLALETTDENAEEASQISNTVYRKLVQDLAVDEATQEDIDFKSLALLELAVRSFNEAIDREGYSRAKIYLGEVAQIKLSERLPLLRMADFFYHFLRRIYHGLVSLWNYFHNVIFREKEEPLQISSQILLAKAEENEKNWQLDEAAELYRKYLELYRESSEAPYVKIALAHILIRQGKLTEAERLLTDVLRRSGGAKEGEIASGLLKRLNSMKNRSVQIAQLKELLPAYEGTPMGEKMQFKLALAYLSMDSLAEAQDAFRKLDKAQDVHLRQKAKFYLGWMYKLQSRYDQGAEMMLALLDEKEIDRELKLGLTAQLADIYYQNNDIEKSLSQYKSLSDKARENILERKAAMESWIGLAEIEQGVIYHFDVGDRVQAQKFLTQAGEYYATNPKFGILRQKLEDVPQLGLRDLAFRQLRARRVHVAFDLFKRNLIRQPKDPWTHSGIATCYILFGDLRRARDYAEAGQRLHSDEYTSAVLGYLMGFYEKYPLSIQYYQESIQKNADYIPPRYNMACMYLKIGQYEKALPLLLGLDVTFRRVKQTLRSKTLNNLGYTLWQLGHQKQAIKRFEQAMQVTPDFIDAKKNLEQIALGGSPKVMTAPQNLAMGEV